VNELPDLLRSEPHRRYDPLRDAWVLVSPGRTDRPWAGAIEEPRVEPPQTYDPDCFLCPGNTRAGGHVNPTYAGAFVFDNDFAALRPAASPATSDRFESGLLVAEGSPGTCRVVCFSPRHDLSLADLPSRSVRDLIDLWADQTTELGRNHGWVQVFENRGSQMGASSPHPHGQIWALSALPVEAAREKQTQATHFQLSGRILLEDYVNQETGGIRVVLENRDWLVVIPFWAVWPFEAMVLPRRRASRLADLDGPARDALAQVLQGLIRAYDALFGVPFPYSMGWHQAPFDGSPTVPWLLHAHVYPPLLRSATVRKFLVGYELLAEPQRDITPEEAAERLRARAS